MERIKLIIEDIILKLTEIDLVTYMYAMIAFSFMLLSMTLIMNSLMQ